MKKYYLLIFSLLCLGINASDAQLNTLLNFDGTNGRAPFCSLILEGSKLYGVTDSGGANNIGCVFSIDTNGNNYKDMLDFNGTNGRWPEGGLTFSNGLLYGTTSQGGVFGEGNIFSIDTDGSKYDNLFDLKTQYGYYPDADLLIVGNKIFGMTPNGGTGYYGVIFSMDTSGWGYKVLFNFNDTNGGYPLFNSLTMIGHKLYGVTTQGGRLKNGVIFSIDTDGSGYKILSDTAQNPIGGLLLCGNKFYGFSGLDEIFSIDTNGKGYKLLFVFNNQNGFEPVESRLLLSGNKLYGTTKQGGPRLTGSDYGVVFSIDTNGKGFKDLYIFNGTDGAYPLGNVTISGKNVYGTTSSGGTNNMGIIFSLDTSAIATSINELPASEAAIYVYPNPSTGLFTFVIANEANPVIASVAKQSQSTIEIYNVLGKKVYSTPLNLPNGGDIEINLSNEPKGVYFYRISTYDGSLIGSGKLVVE